MALAAAGEARVLTGLLNSVYVSLHTSDPTTDGAGEVSGGDYARAAATFIQSGTNPTTASNDATVQFAQASSHWGTVTHFGLWSAASGGDFLIGGSVTTPKAIYNGDIARWDVGSLTVTAD